MKKLFFYSLILTFLLCAGQSSKVNAQALNRSAAVPPPPREGDQPPPGQINLVRDLNLSADQIKQLRLINQQRRPMMQAAQRRVREANQQLDQAVYADVENDSEIQARIRDVQAAQAEMILNRTITERAIKKILTAEQLARFRELRIRFAQDPDNPPGFRNRRNRLKNGLRNSAGPGNKNRPPLR